jgi:ABC-2 type transport system permease protein
MNLWTSLRKELMEQIRTSRLLVLLAILGFFGLTSPLMARYISEIMRLVPGGEQFTAMIPPPTVNDAIAQYIKNTSQFGIVMALLLSMGSIAQEKEHGTAALMLVKPLPRVSFLLGKFLALALVFAIALLVAGLGAYLYTAVLFQVLDLGAWLALNGLMWLEMLVFVALTLLFSTLFRSQAAAVGLGFGMILLFALLGSLPTLGELQPGQLVVWGASLFGPAPVSAWPALWVSLGLIALSLLAAWLVFRRQEL